MIFVALTNSVGGFETIAPDAKLDDGQFTLIMVKTANLFELVDLIRPGPIQGGKHIYDKRISYIKTSSLDIEPLGEDRMMINLDGEYGGDAPIHLQNLKNHIEFYANIDEISDDAITLPDTDDLALEAIAQKFSTEAEKIEND